MAPCEAKCGVAFDVGDIKTCVCYAQTKDFTDMSYRGYFLARLCWEKRIKTEERCEQTSEIQEERRVTDDFEYLVVMQYRDDDNGLMER